MSHMRLPTDSPRSHHKLRLCNVNESKDLKKSNKSKGHLTTTLVAMSHEVNASFLCCVCSHGSTSMRSDESKGRTHEERVAFM